MASKQSEELKTLYKGWVAALGANPDMPLDELRRMFEHWGDVTAEPGGVDYVETDCRRACRRCGRRRRAAREDRVLLCTHGGGYVTGSMYTHRKVYGHFAKAIGCRALIVHYGRAPENVHPGPVDDMVDAIAGCSTRVSRRSHIALTGDSAGGGLADHHDPAGARARPADAGRHDAAVALARHGGDRRDFESNGEKDVLVVARHHPGDGRRRSWAKRQPA